MSVFRVESPGFAYSRSGNPTKAAIEAKLACLEGGEACAATGSGMGAVGSVLVAFLKGGDHVICEKCIYGCSAADIVAHSVTKYLNGYGDIIGGAVIGRADDIKLISRDFFQLGAGFTLCSPVASGTILRKDGYMEFVYPYTVELVNYYHEHGASVTYHIYGNTNKIIEAMTDTGTDILSIDNIIDLKATKERVGDKVCIAGNVPPVQVMLEGSIDDDESVKACFESAWDSPKGYILATGCGISNTAPAKSVFQFMSSARKYGRVAAEKTSSQMIISLVTSSVTAGDIIP